MTVRWPSDALHLPEPPDRRISSGEEASSTPVRDFLADLSASFDAAAKTVGVIGAVLVLYVTLHGLWVALCDINHVLYHLGALLAAAANGAPTP